MPNQKVILLAQAEVRPEYRDEIIAVAKATLERTLLERGCETFYQTAVEDDPNKLVFFEVFLSEQDHEIHLSQDYAKQFFATLDGKLVAPPTFTRLSSLSV